MTARGEGSTSWTGGDSADLMDTPAIPRCRATAKQTGKRCRRRPVPGGTVCVIHGGGAPAVRAAAARRKAEAEATALLDLIWDPQAQPVTDPIDALQALAGRLQHAANTLGARLESSDLDGPTALAWSRVLRELRLALDGMARLGLEERVIALAADRAQMVVTAFTTAVDLLRLVPTDRSMVVQRFLDGLEIRGDEPSVPAAMDVMAAWAGGEFAGVMRAVLDRIELSDEQWALVALVVPEEFRRVGAQGSVVRGELE